MRVECGESSLLVAYKKKLCYAYSKLRHSLRTEYEIQIIKPIKNEPIAFHFIPKRAQCLTLTLYRLLSKDDETFVDEDDPIAMVMQKEAS